MDNKKKRKNNFQEIKTIFKLLNQQTQVKFELRPRISRILLDPLYIVIFIYRVSHQYRYKFNFKFLILYQTVKVKSVLKSLDQNLQGATLIFIFSKKINIF